MNTINASSPRIPASGIDVQLHWDPTSAENTSGCQVVLGLSALQVMSHLCPRDLVLQVSGHALD